MVSLTLQCVLTVVSCLDGSFWKVTLERMLLIILRENDKQVEMLMREGERDGRMTFFSGKTGQQERETTTHAAADDTWLLYCLIRFHPSKIGTRVKNSEQQQQK